MRENLNLSHYKFGNFFLMNSINQLISDIKSNKLLPIYFLMGDETYYIDMISDYIESNVLSEQ